MQIIEIDESGKPDQKDEINFRDENHTTCMTRSNSKDILAVE